MSFRQSTSCSCRRSPALRPTSTSHQLGRLRAEYYPKWPREGWCRSCCNPLPVCKLCSPNGIPSSTRSTTKLKWWARIRYRKVPLSVRRLENSISIGAVSSCSARRALDWATMTACLPLKDCVKVNVINRKLQSKSITVRNPNESSDSTRKKLGTVLHLEMVRVISHPNLRNLMWTID